MTYLPARGDIVWLEFDPQAGHEQSGTRPALILSPLAYNKKVGLAILCPITQQKKGYPFEIEIPSGTPVEGVILTDQLKSLNWRARKTRFVCTLPQNIMDNVLAKSKTLLD